MQSVGVAVAGPKTGRTQRQGVGGTGGAQKRQHRGRPYNAAKITSASVPADLRTHAQTHSLHILHDRLPELAAFEQLSALQVALEVVRHALLSDGVLQPVEDGVGRFVPAHVLKHDPAR